MPRSEMNNPTERMRRILEEITDLEECYIFARNLMAEHAPNLYVQLPPEPSLINIEKERTRQQLTGAKVKYAREAVRRLRLRGVVEKHESFKTDKLPTWRRNQGLSADIERQIDKEVEKFLASGIKTWQPNNKCPATGGPCPMESEENCVCLHPELR